MHTNILPTEIHKFKTADGALLYARLIKPAGFTRGGKYPVIVMVYGGPHAQEVRRCMAAPRLGPGAGAPRICDLAGG